MPKSINFPGKKYGDWTIVRRDKYIGNNLHYLCRCKCGVEASVNSSNLTTGMSTKCRKCGHEARRKNYHQPTRDYYGDLKSRNLLCDYWNKEFLNFFNDVGTKKKGVVLRPIDYGKKLGPNNFKWTKRITNLQKGLYTHQNLTLPLDEWCRLLGISKQRFHQRLKAGYTGNKLFTRRNRKYKKTERITQEQVDKINEILAEKRKAQGASDEKRSKSTLVNQD